MKKSEALRKAAANLREYPNRYNWSQPARCNCGILAQVILGLPPATLQRKLIPMSMTTWTSLFKRMKGNTSARCRVTDMDTMKMIESLTDVGFTVEELSALGYLEYRDWKYTNHYSEAEHVIAYMDEWAAELEQEGK